MRIITLVENRPSPSDPELVAEWGLSLYVEIGRHRILVDMGASDAFARNAKRLGVDIAAIDAAILSHHHYDHGGGLRRFLELNATAKVFIGERPAGQPTARVFGLLKRNIGLDQSLFGQYPDRFRFVEKCTDVVPGVCVLPNIGGEHPRPSGNKILFIRKGGNYVPDAFRHEVVVVLRERGSLVVLTGCSHNGLVNMVETVVREFPGIPIKAVVGGFHLVALPHFKRMSDSEPVVAGIGQAVLNLGVGTTYTGHCTGSKAFEVLRHTMGDRVREIRTGSLLEI